MSQAVSQLPFVKQTPTVAIYNVEEQRWESVQKSSQDFPISIKMTITPEWAQEVMTHRNRSNRPLNKRRIQKIARDIVAGNFQVINNGVGFYEDGSLADAQHRLAAVVEANLPVRAFVVFGMERPAGTVIDDGRPRSDRDVAHLSGLELSGTFVSTANYLLELMGVQYTRAEKLEFYEKHKEAINLVVNGVTKKYLARAPILAALVKAYYHVDKGRLIDFMDVLQTGKFNEGADDGAFRLREWAMENGSRNDGSFRLEIYNKTKGALQYFLKKQPMTKLYGVREDVWLLPEEIIAKKEQSYQNRSEAMKQVRLREKRNPKPVQPPLQKARSPEEYGG